ncbi:MAG: hypothetical protein MUF72_11890 [Elainella sp. Prado103]|jgi:hypothetical protein|nr:hypothetical protein [Elainella sp. Prado103]
MVKSSFKDRFEKSFRFKQHFQQKSQSKQPQSKQPQSKPQSDPSPSKQHFHLWMWTRLSDRLEHQPSEGSQGEIRFGEMRIEGINDSNASPTGTSEAPLKRSPHRFHPPKLPQPQLPEALKPWRWSLVWLAALGILGGMGTAALIWLISLPPQVDCRNPARLSLDMEKLYCAQEAAQNGELPKLVDGIKLLSQWTADHPLQREAQRLINDWSDQIFTIAIREVEKGNLKAAESAIGQIPNSAEIYTDAQKAIVRWRKYSQDASDLYATAEKALKQRDWATVSQQIVRLAEFERDYWELQKGADALVKQMGVEKQAWQTLIRAQKMAAGSLTELGEAIPLAQQVPPDTYAAETAKADLKRWSEKLLTAGVQQWQKGDRDGTLKTLQLPSRLKNTPEVADLYRFSQAYQLAASAIAEQWEPSVGELLTLHEAIAALKQVPSNSPFHTQAQSLTQQWQSELEDLVQLKYASMAAKWGQHSTLELAIGQAKLIEAKRPRRLQAQSMIAHWQQETERLEDQPILNRAKRLAETGTIASLQSAIAEASEVKLGRALRQSAQTLIATWRSQIQTLEDRPMLARAEVLAEQGELNAAIVAASEIQPGRSLYSQAQAAISEWREQLVVDAQIAQDQPILDRANALADSGNLAGAIRVASEIGSGRALSQQAQTAINRWEQQLYPPAPTPPDVDDARDNWIPADQNYFDQPEDSAIDRSTDPPESGANSFPSPSPNGFPTPGSSPNPLPELQLVPPSSYQPLPQSSEQPLPAASPNFPAPSAPSAAPTEEPMPPSEPLPPASLDPLPPSSLNQ